MQLFRAASTRAERDDPGDAASLRMRSLLNTEALSAGEERPREDVAAMEKIHGLTSFQLISSWGIEHMKKRLFASNVTPQEQRHLAASIIQRIFRGHLLRKTKKAHFHRINLKYEMTILEERKRRRGLLFGFIQHVCYMVLLATVIQSGASVSSRFEMEGVVANSVSDTGFEDLSTLAEYNSWMRGSFFGMLRMDRSGRIFLKTYNEVIGSLRLEVLRVDSYACAWKTADWRASYRLDEESDTCYGWLSPGTMANASYGPSWDDDRYTSTYRSGEHRYIIDLGRNPQYAWSRVQELAETGFVDEMTTRVVRIRLLTYNPALAMLCALAVEASLSPTGVLRTSYRTASVPVQEYMPHSFHQTLFLQILLLVWTCLQLFKEIYECAREVRATGSCLSYLAEPFNVLDGLRFVLFFTAVGIRINLNLDTSRDFDLSTKTFVDTEDVQAMYSYFDLVTCYVTIVSLLSTIQYFALAERTNMLKGTLARAGAAMSTFFFIFLLFFLTYALIGSYLLGAGLEAFSSFMNSVHTSFEMMNANIPFESLLGGVEDSTLTILTICFYYYSFIAIHYLLLLNVIIAIVVDAYMEVQEDHSSTVAKTFRRNLGSLGQDLLNISWRTFYTSWLVMASRLNPMALLQRSKPIFVEWSDDDWLEILARVMEVRRSKGIPSRGTTLATLTREIKKLPHKNRTVADRFAQAGMSAMACAVQDTTRVAAGAVSSTVDVVSNVSDVRFSGLPRASGSAQQSTAGSPHATSVPTTNAVEQSAADEDPVFRQVVRHFFDRPYWSNPTNLAEPLDDNAQPPGETWYDCTLERIANQVDLLDRRSISTAMSIHLLQHDVAGNSKGSD